MRSKNVLARIAGASSQIQNFMKGKKLWLFEFIQLQMSLTK